MQPNDIRREDEIRQIAYRLWQEAGCPQGNGVNHWLAAEALWLDEQGRKKQNARPKTTRSRKKTRTGLSEAEL